jgi:quinol monooxygenase YgiN
MAVLAYGQPSITQEMYDGMAKQTHAAMVGAPGFIAHLAGPTPTGWSVTEVWESQAAAEAYYRDTVAPMLEGAGGGMPEIQFRPLHNVVLNSKG